MSQRYPDEILRPIVVLLICPHHLMFQHDNAWPHVARICTQFKELKMSQFFHGLHTHQTCHPLSMFGMLWINVFDSVFQFLPIFSNFVQPLKRIGTTFHMPQSTAWSTLWEGDVSLLGHTRYWLFFFIHAPTFFLRYLWPTDSSFSIGPLVQVPMYLWHDVNSTNLCHYQSLMV